MKPRPQVESLRTGDLRRQVAARYPTDHPLTIATQNLPETLLLADYLALLRALLPLARIGGDGR